MLSLKKVLGRILKEGQLNEVENLRNLIKKDPSILKKISQKLQSVKDSGDMEKYLKLRRMVFNLGGSSEKLQNSPSPYKDDDEKINLMSLLSDMSDRDEVENVKSYSDVDAPWEPGTDSDKFRKLDKNIDIFSEQFFTLRDEFLKFQESVDRGEGENLTANDVNQYKELIQKIRQLIEMSQKIIKHNPDGPFGEHFANFYPTLAEMLKVGKRSIRSVERDQYIKNINDKSIDNFIKRREEGFNGPTAPLDIDLRSLLDKNFPYNPKGRNSDRTAMSAEESKKRARDFNDRRKRAIVKAGFKP